MEQIGNNVDASPFDFGGLRILVLVDHVLVECLRHQAFGLWLHPSCHEGCEIQSRITVKHQFFVDDSVRDLRWRLRVGQPISRERADFEAGGKCWCELGVDPIVAIVVLLNHGCHRSECAGSPGRPNRKGAMTRFGQAPNLAILSA